jgi:hypothetical protein
MQHIIIDSKLGKKWILTDLENEYGTIKVEYYEYSFICQAYYYLGEENCSKEFVFEEFGVKF